MEETILTRTKMPRPNLRGLLRFLAALAASTIACILILGLFDSSGLLRTRMNPPQYVRTFKLGMIHPHDAP